MRAPETTARTADHESNLESAALITLIGLPALAHAAEPEVLDEDFLEYLAEFDDEEDDWSWFDGEEKASDRTTSSDAERSATSHEKVEP
jgi:hypothetical protein